LIENATVLQAAKNNSKLFKT